MAPIEIEESQTILSDIALNYIKRVVETIVGLASPTNGNAANEIITYLNAAIGILNDSQENISNNEALIIAKALSAIQSVLSLPDAFSIDLISKSSGTTIAANQSVTEYIVSLLFSAIEPLNAARIKAQNAAISSTNNATDIVTTVINTGLAWLDKLLEGINNLLLVGFEFLADRLEDLLAIPAKVFFNLLRDALFEEVK